MGIRKVQTHHILCQVCNNLQYTMGKPALVRCSSNVYWFLLLLSLLRLQFGREIEQINVHSCEMLPQKYEFFPFLQRNQRIILASDTKKPLKRLVLRGYIQKKDIMKSIHHQTKIVPWAMFAQTITALQMNAVLSPFQGLEIEDVSLTGGSHPRLCSVAPLVLFTGQ